MTLPPSYWSHGRESWGWSPHTTVPLTVNNRRKRRGRRGNRGIEYLVSWSLPSKASYCPFPCPAVSLGHRRLVCPFSWHSQHSTPDKSLTLRRGGPLSERQSCVCSCLRVSSSWRITVDSSTIVCLAIGVASSVASSICAPFMEAIGGRRGLLAKAQASISTTMY